MSRVAADEPGGGETNIRVQLRIFLIQIPFDLPGKVAIFSLATLKRWQRLQGNMSSGDD